MKQIKEIQEAIDYLDKYWPKGHKERGEALCLLALGQIGGREEMRHLIHQEEAFVSRENKNE